MNDSAVEDFKKRTGYELRIPEKVSYGYQTFFKKSGIVHHPDQQNPQIIIKNSGRYRSNPPACTEKRPARQPKIFKNEWAGC